LRTVRKTAARIEFRAAAFFSLWAEEFEAEETGDIGKPLSFYIIIATGDNQEAGQVPGGRFATPRNQARPANSQTNRKRNPHIYICGGWSEENVSEFIGEFY
jgi:hypothetical protein